MRGRTGFGLATMLSAAMLLAGASELNAQQTTRYKGFWIGFGFGGGWSGTAAPGTTPWAAERSISVWGER